MMSLKEFNSTVRQEEKKISIMTCFMRGQKAQAVTELTGFEAKLLRLSGSGPHQREATLRTPRRSHGLRPHPALLRCPAVA